MPERNLEEVKLEKIKPEKFGDFDRIEDEFLPFLHLNSEQVIEVHNWEVGGHYRMVIDIRQDSKDVDKISGIASGGFKIVAYKVIKGKNIENMTDQELEIEQGKALQTKREESSISNNTEDR